MRLGLGHGLDVGYRPELFGASSYLLDTYSGAAAAYSLRQLRTGVTSVVRVRRSSDDAEADFTAVEVSDGTLTTWTGAGDGFCVTWYDQSGNGRNATQATAANQPKIVNAGVLVEENGKPALEFDGVNDYFLAFNISFQTIFSVFKSNSYPVRIGSGINSTIGVSSDIVGYCRPQAGAITVDKSYNYSSPSTYQILTHIYNDSNQHNQYKNSESATENPFSDLGLLLWDEIGRFGTAVYDWNCQEIIVYASDKSADRAAIEAAINSHYSIY